MQRIKAIAIALAFTLAACGGLSDEEATTLAKSEIDRLSAQENWPETIDLTGPIKGEGGAKLFYVTAAVEGEEGRSEQYWGIKVTKSCKRFSNECETQTATERLDKPGVWIQK